MEGWFRRGITHRGVSRVMGQGGDRCGIGRCGDGSAHRGRWAWCGLRAS